MILYVSHVGVFCWWGIFWNPGKNLYGTATDKEGVHSNTQKRQHSILNHGKLFSAQVTSRGMAMGHAVFIRKALGKILLSKPKWDNV